MEDQRLVKTGKKIVRFIGEKPALSILLSIIAVIFLRSIKFNLYTIGWDNFSSYFVIPTNIFRTFFATWREYRGLGVPSDSEATDLFRQLFFLILSPFLPQTVLDQIYMLFSLFLGIFALYILAFLLFKKYVLNNSQKADIFAALTSFFYLFNLNTLATFYFPMIMYINRFFTLPLLLLIFYLFSQKQINSKKQYLLCILGILFASGSFITATIFITIVIFLFIFFIFSENKKRLLLIFTFYLAINAFWLLPFFNYTLQKSKIIRLSPNFIPANEMQLNKPKSYYDLDKQLILYHNFFDTSFTGLTNGEKLYFNSITQNLKNPLYKIILGIFPFLFLIGSVLMFIKHKKFKNLFWLPITVFLFLFLSLKEYWALGFVYSFLNNLSPFFGVLFRFGDTKFHAFIAFGASFLASLTLFYILNYVKKVVGYVVIFIVIVSTIFIFKDYFNGIIGKFMYNKIPIAYFEIAKIINEDKENFRVLHLPFEEEGYWKSYSWGAFGSSFLNFMLNKPFIDKTFEPASMENAYLHKKISSILSNLQLVKNSSQKQKRAEDFARLLKEVGVKYLIIDETVQSELYIKGETLWGKFNKEDTKLMGEYLEEFGFARKIKSYDVNLIDIQKEISDLYPLKEEENNLFLKNGESKTRLLEIKNPNKWVQFVSSSQNLDSDFDNVLESDLLSKDETFIQDKSTFNYKIYPFKRNNLALNSNDQFSFMLNLPEKVENISLTMPSDLYLEQNSNILDVYVKKLNENLILSFYHQKTPNINGYTEYAKLEEVKIDLGKINQNQVRLGQNQVLENLNNYFSDWNILKNQTVGNLRLNINDYILPIPSLNDGEEKKIASVFVKGKNVSFEILSLSKKAKIENPDFFLTDNPNCFLDRLENSSFEVAKKNNFTITSKNQSTCVFYILQKLIDKNTSHLELSFELNGEYEDLDKNFDFSKSDSSKPLLTEFVNSLEKPNLVRFCVKEFNVDNCYNKHQLLNVKGQTLVKIPLEKPIKNSKNLTILLSPKNTSYQKQKIEIQNMEIDQYEKLENGNFSILDSQVLLNMPIPKTKQLQISFPKAQSLYSFFFDSKLDGFYGMNASCDKKEGYKTFRLINNKLLSFIKNCSSDIFETLNFSSDNFYLWNYSYNLMSGKYPNFLLFDNFYSYLNNLVSLNQGYPDIKEFKSFQKPEMWYEKYSKKDFAKNTKLKISNLTFQNAYAYIYPSFDLIDESQKQFTIHQDSENEGVMLIKNFDILPLPNNWKDLTIEINNFSKNFDLPKDFGFKKILPSLWRVEVNSVKQGQKLLFFNQGYDKQWVAYDNLLGVLFGFSKKFESKRCNGFANCFVIDTKTNRETIYLFYTPERLSILGWIVTITCSIFFLKILVKKGRNTV